MSGTLAMFQYPLTLIFQVIPSTKGIIWEGIFRNYSLLGSWSMEYIAPGRLINLCDKKLERSLVIMKERYQQPSHHVTIYCAQKYITLVFVDGI